MNMKIAMEPLRNSKETLNTQSLMILRTFQHWPKFLVSFKNTCIQTGLLFGTTDSIALQLQLQQHFLQPPDFALKLYLAMFQEDQLYVNRTSWNVHQGPMLCNDCFRFQQRQSHLPFRRMHFTPLSVSIKWK